MRTGVQENPLRPSEKYKQGHIFFRQTESSSIDRDDKKHAVDKSMLNNLQIFAPMYCFKKSFTL
jgi:hypothetical protein